MRRVRLGLVGSVRAAVSAANATPKPGAGAEQDLLGMAFAIPIGLWWWLRGAPPSDDTNSPIT